MPEKIQVEFAKGAEQWCKDLFLGRFNGTGIEAEEAEGAPYLVATPHTWLDRRNAADFLGRMQGRVTILDSLGEALSPDLNIFDYTIGFDKTQLGDRFVYWPVGMDRYLDIADKCKEKTPEQKAAGHVHFCSYLYSNWNCHPTRLLLFYGLNAYKPVHAPGACFNNTAGDGLSCTDGKGDWYVSSIRIKEKFKFGISAENAHHMYYTSEKIATTFLAGSVPIYWGNPCIEEDYNPEAFVNAGRYDSIEDLVAGVKRLDGDDDAYMQMLAAPCKTEAQQEAYREAYKRGREMFCNIFTQPVQKALRRGVGTLTETYRSTMRSAFGEVSRNKS